MKKIGLLICIFGLFTLKAQNIRIEKQAFPVVKLKTSSETLLSKENVKILQNGKDIPCDVTAIGAETPEPTKKEAKTVLVLLENSGFTNATILSNFKQGIGTLFKSLPEGTRINIATFAKAGNNASMLNTLSADFSTNKTLLLDALKEKITPLVGSQPRSDVHKAIYEALEYLNKNSSTAEKQLFIFTAGINRSDSPLKIEDCIAKANTNKVQVFSCIYKTGYPYAEDNFRKLADQTNSQSQLVSSTSEISEALENFSKTDTTASTDTQVRSKDFEITFILPDTSQLEGLQINLNGNLQSLDFGAKEKIKESKTSPPFLWYGLGAAGLLGVLIFYLLQQKNKKTALEAQQQDLRKQSLQKQQKQFIQEQQGLQQQMQSQFQADLTQTKQPTSDKFDPKHTFIGVGGGVMPTLLASGQGFSQTFTLHKPNLSIGRKENNDIVLPIPTISSSHASLVQEAGNWYISDNNSTNGVLVNGKKIQKQGLKQNDKIQLGDCVLVFRL